MANNNLEKGVTWRFGPARPLQSCGARTRRGTACQKPPLNGKTRCRLRGYNADNIPATVFTEFKETS